MRVYPASERSTENVGFFVPEYISSANSPRVTQQCQQLAALLREIRDRANVQDSNRITDLLDEVSLSCPPFISRVNKGSLVLT